MPNSIFDAQPLRDEKAAYAYVEARIWPNGRVCPHCGTIDRSGLLKGKSTRIGVYKCYACRKPFTVKIGTIFEDSHVPMHFWLQAIVLMCGSKKGISTNQLHRTLGVTLRTAWHMSHRIRLAMDESGSGTLGGEGQVLESDETYTVYKEGGPTWILHPQYGWQKRRSGSDRVPVVTLVERGGRARSRKVENVTAATLRGVVFGAADTKSRLMIDELRAYRHTGERFAGHDAVNHGEEEWSRQLRTAPRRTPTASNAASMAAISTSAKATCIDISLNSISATATARPLASMPPTAQPALLSAPLASG